MINVKFVNEPVVLPANPVDVDPNLVKWKIVEDPITREKLLVVNSTCGSYRFTKFVQNSLNGVFLESQIANYVGPIGALGYVLGYGWFKIRVRGIVSLESTLLPGVTLDLKQYCVVCLKNHLPIDDMVDSPLSIQIVVDGNGCIHEHDISDFIEDLCDLRDTHESKIKTLCDEYNNDIKSLMEKYSTNIPNEAD